MPLTKEARRRLEDEYQRLSALSAKAGPRNGEIPVGGGGWMDCFFRAEALRGLLGGLRGGKSPKDSIADGVAMAEVATEV